MKILTVQVGTVNASALTSESNQQLISPNHFNTLSTGLCKSGANK